MKWFVLVSILLVSATQAQAQGSSRGWVKVIDCGNGAVVMDQYVPNPREPSGIHQIVVRQPDLIRAMVDSEAVPRARVNSRRELIVSVQLEPSRLPTFVYKGEGDAYQQDGEGVAYFVQPDGSQLLFQSYPTKQFDRRAPYVLGKIPVGSWTIKNCRFARQRR